MSATDELRRMLDERGVEWWEAWDKDLTIFDGAHGVRYMADHTLGEWFIRSVLPITAEQAIAATLGGGECETCHAESDLSEWVCSECQCWIPLGLTPENIGRASELRFCPHCGRKVVG